MTIGKVMGVTSYSKVIGVTSPASVMGVAAGGGGELIIEDFDSINGSDLPNDYPDWHLTTDVNNTRSLSALHVTQGTGSFKVINTAGGSVDLFMDTLGPSSTTYMDLTGYSTVSVDVYFQTSPDTNAYLVVNDNGKGSAVSSNFAGMTGAQTLSVSIASLNKSAVYIYFSFSGSAGMEVYFDNLRAIP